MCALELKVLVHLTRQCSANVQFPLEVLAATQERMSRTQLRLVDAETGYRELSMLKQGSLPQVVRQPHRWKRRTQQQKQVARVI